MTFPRVVTFVTNPDLENVDCSIKIDVRTRDKPSFFLNRRPSLIKSWICQSKRLFSTEDQTGLSYTTEKELFSNQTGSAKQFSRLAHPVAKSRRFDRMYESDCSVENVFEPIASSSPHKSTHTPTHARTLGITLYPTTASTLARLLSLLLLLLAPRQHATFLAPPDSSVYYTMAAARDIKDILPTTVTLAVALAALL